MPSKPFSVRAPVEEIEEWKAFARTQGITFNKFCLKAIRGQYELDKAESREREEQIAERERMKVSAFPLGEAKCNHVVAGQYCYRCQRKRWS